MKALIFICLILPVLFCLPPQSSTDSGLDRVAVDRLKLEAIQKIDCKCLSYNIPDKSVPRGWIKVAGKGFEKTVLLASFTYWDMNEFNQICRQIGCPVKLERRGKVLLIKKVRHVMYA